MKAQGINSSLSEEVQTMVQPETFTVTQSIVKQEYNDKQRQCAQITSPVPQITSPIPHSTLNFDDLMDESSPVVSDPMLSSQPLVHDEAMDYVLWNERNSLT